MGEQEGVKQEGGQCEPLKTDSQRQRVTTYALLKRNERPE